MLATPMVRGVARHNFKRRQISPSLPKTGVRGFYPGIFFKFCIAVESFGIFSENENKLSYPLKRGSGVFSPGKCLNSALLYESFSTYIFGERIQTFLSPETKDRSFVPGKFVEFCIVVTVGEFWYIFGE